MDDAQTAVQKQPESAQVSTRGPRPVLPTLLASGDRLTRAEFHRRYEAMPETVQAELIEGVVYVSSPLRAKSHGEPHHKMSGWLFIYLASSPGLSVADNATVILDPDNEVQPDLVMRIDAAAGGGSRLNDDDYVEGPPELIVEIAASCASYDLHDKKNAYRRNGVQEYLVWRVLDGAIDWWELVEGVYVPLPADETGIVCSHVFPSLCLDVTAMLAGDLARVMAVQQERLGSTEHAAFAARLGSG
jgi:Uma2 family endonuclease